MRQTATVLVALALAVAACVPAPPNDEEQGAAMLQEARLLLAGGNTDAARDTILSLRLRYPHAFRVRRAAVLTMDSVELEAARQEGDSLKMEFYKRKLQHDTENATDFTR